MKEAYLIVSADGRILQSVRTHNHEQSTLEIAGKLPADLTPEARADELAKQLVRQHSATFTIYKPVKAFRLEKPVVEAELP